jgi:suppressor for copper-sensitivity B
MESALVTAAVLTALLILLAWRSRRDGQGPGSKVIAVAAGGLAAAVIAVPSLMPAARTGNAPELQAGLWRPFDLDAVHRLVAEGKLVLVDVTAGWCLTCKVNETAVLDRAPVLDRLRDPGVIAMRADWTRPDPAITAYLQSFGRYGVPLDVVYGASRPDGEPLPELLTSANVLRALEHAGPPPTGVAAR